MKVGIRTPSLKKSISARTKGKVTRSIKKSIDPTYGKKGVGLYKNPKKAMYNKVYSKTTKSAIDTPTAIVIIIMMIIIAFVWLFVNTVFLNY